MVVTPARRSPKDVSLTSNVQFGFPQISWRVKEEEEARPTEENHETQRKKQEEQRASPPLIEIQQRSKKT